MLSFNFSALLHNRGLPCVCVGEEIDSLNQLMFIKDFDSLKKTKIEIDINIYISIYIIIYIILYILIYIYILILERNPFHLT